ncbi:MAG: hypothetical protein EOO24_06215 [Comamonadaceae bacterium]|nr:MAG: hypothetical protein EOO24_06215 [Comamonadaceae bacterium]
MRGLVHRFALAALPALAALSMIAAPGPVRAQSELSVGLSMLPVASVVGAASVAGAAAGAVAALPAALSVGGAVLTVKAVQASANGTVYLLERASDGAAASVEVSARAGRQLSVAVGSAVLVGAISTGMILSVAGEAICFLPNAAGRALLHNERLS